MFQTVPVADAEGPCTHPAETAARFKFAKREGPCVLTAQIRDNIAKPGTTPVQVLNHPPTAKMSFVTRRALSTLIPPKVSLVACRSWVESGEVGC